MYHNPRRPFYNYRTEDMPQDSSSPHSAVIDSKRFWKLVRMITRRQKEAKEALENDDQDEAAIIR
jgi:hypothetical protein